MSKIIQSQISKNIDYRSQIALQEVLEKAYRFISIRPRSRHEIVEYLTKKTKMTPSKNLPPDWLQKILQILQQGGLLNDEKFAAWWIEQRSTFRPKGGIALEKELEQKGIDKEIINKVLSQSIDEISLAKNLAEKKMKFYQRLPYPKLRQKMTSFLARRGFSWATIKVVLDEFKRKY